MQSYIYNHIYACGPKTVPVKRTFLNIAIVGGWGGVGGHVNVPCTSYMIYCHAAKISGIIYYVTCCYAAEISGIVYYVTCRYAAEISGIVYYVTYMLLRCWDLWYRLLRYIHVATLLRSLGSFTTLHTCCYAAEISGIVYYVTCCYAAEISGIVYYVTCRYAAEISGIVYYVAYMLLRCWDLWDLWELGNGDAFTRMLTASCLLRMRCSDDAEKRKNAPQVFPGFPIIKLARHCGKITIFLKHVRFMGTVSGPAGYLCIITHICNYIYHIYIYIYRIINGVIYICIYCYLFTLW